MRAELKQVLGLLSPKNEREIVKDVVTGQHATTGLDVAVRAIGKAIKDVLRPKTPEEELTEKKRQEEIQLQLLREQQRVLEERLTALKAQGAMMDRMNAGAAHEKDSLTKQLEAVMAAQQRRAA